MLRIFLCGYVFLKSVCRCCKLFFIVGKITTFVAMITQPQIFLRPVQQNDAEAIYHHLKNPNITKMLLRIPTPFTMDDAYDFLNRVEAETQKETDWVWAIVSRETNELLGLCGAHIREGNRELVELGYWIGQEYWGKGIATEAIRQQLALMKTQLHFTKVFATVFEGNNASKGVLLKNGFEYMPSKNKWLDKGNEKIYALCFEKMLT